MPTTFSLPDTPVVVAADPNQRKRVSAASTAHAYADDQPLEEPIVVEHAVVLRGYGVVTVEETEDKATVKPPKDEEVVNATELAPEVDSKREQRAEKRSKK